MLRVLGELMHVDDMGDAAKLVQGAQGGPPLEGFSTVTRKKTAKPMKTTSLMAASRPCSSSEIPAMDVWNGIDRIRPAVAPTMTIRPRITATRMGQ